MNHRYVSNIYIGFASITCQIILLREFYVVFMGNELSLGIVLANWLFLTALGSILSGFFCNKKFDIKNLFLLSCTIPVILLPAEVLIIRALRTLANIPLGEHFPLVAILLWSFLLLIPGCLIAGMQFNFACELFKDLKSQHQQTGSYIYMYETLGALLGSIVLTFILINIFDVFYIITILISVNFFVVYYLTKKPLFMVVSIVVIAFLFTPLAHQASKGFEVYRWHNINKDLKLVETTESHYGNLVVVEYSGELTLYDNTKNSGILPANYDIQLITHIAMNESPAPKRILLIGGGVNGYISELLKYNPEQIDYIELDPKIVNLASKYLPDQEKQDLKSIKVHIISDDPRHYVNTTNKKYDVIISNIPEPFNASLNRFYTLEYFKKIEGLLNADGLYAFSLSSSENYLGPELGQLNASVYQTIKKCLKYTLIIPGNPAIFLGAKNNILTKDYNILSRRYIDHKAGRGYFSPEMFEQYMQPEKINFIELEISNFKNFKINSDLSPISYYLDLLIYNKYTRTTNDLFNFAEKITLPWLAFIIIAIALILSIVEKKLKANFSYEVSMVIVSFTGISLSILLMLWFQNIYGGLYYYIGLVIATFMGGIALGAYVFNLKLSQENNLDRHIKILLLGLIILCFSLPSILYLVNYLNIVIIFFFINIACGCCVGLGYSLINKGYLNTSSSCSNSVIYAFDLFGASLGALIISAFLIPLWGLIQTCAFLAIINSLVVLKLTLHRP